jgi:hypothetical protein
MLKKYGSHLYNFSNKDLISMKDDLNEPLEQTPESYAKFLEEDSDEECSSPEMPVYLFGSNRP